MVAESILISATPVLLIIAVLVIAVFVGVEELIVASIIIEAVVLAAIAILDIDTKPAELLPAGDGWLLLLAPVGMLITLKDEILLGKLSLRVIPDMDTPLVSIRSIVYRNVSPACTLPPLRSITVFLEFERSAEITL